MSSPGVPTRQEDAGAPKALPTGAAFVSSVDLAATVGAERLLGHTILTKRAPLFGCIATPYPSAMKNLPPFFEFIGQAKYSGQPLHMANVIAPTRMTIIGFKSLGSMIFIHGRNY